MVTWTHSPVADTHWVVVYAHRMVTWTHCPAAEAYRVVFVARRGSGRGASYGVQGSLDGGRSTTNSCSGVEELC